ncbi:MAG: LURP-one-related/scramblase family protein [Candidatus Nanohaloarchaea archaeon]
MEDILKSIDFDSEEFTVKQSLVRNKYQVFNGEQLILKAKQKMFKMREEFPFTDADDNPLFTIKAAKRLDIAGDYGIIDAATDEEVAVLSKKFTLLKHIWKVKDTGGNVKATIESDSALMELLRALHELLSFIPHSYTITDESGEEIGSIKGRFSLRDTYDVRVDRDAPFREAVVAAAVTIDTLEGN